MTDAELLHTLDRLKALMIAVATGGPRIGEVETEFARLYDNADQELMARRVRNPLPYRDLWEWYGRWTSGDMRSWQSRRVFVNDLFGGLDRDIQDGRRPPQAQSVEQTAPATEGEVEWDVFLSHASEDTVAIAEPLAGRLRQLGLDVWFDGFTLKLGDSLRQSIDRGLLSSRFGVVIISSAFLAKDWPQRELDAMVALEVDGRKVILPILHGLTVEELRRRSPTLADRLSANSSEGIESVARQIVDVVRPEGATPSAPPVKASSTSNQPPGELIRIGPDIIALGDIESIEPLRWELHLREFLAGDIGKLIRYAEAFGEARAMDRFVVVNSFGDGRALTSAPSLSKASDGYKIRLAVAAGALRDRVQDLGSSLATSPKTHDLYVELGDIARVSGAPALPQRLREVLSHMRGESPMYPDFGSRLQEYYWRYQDSPWLLDMLKAELIRLSAIPYIDELQRRSYTPLPSIERVWGVEVLLPAPAENRLPLRIDLDVTGLGRSTFDVSVLMPPAETVNKYAQPRSTAAAGSRGDLQFPENQHHTESTRGTVFWGEEGGNRVRCIISREALDDHFSDGDRLRPATAFEAHQAEIEAFARQKYSRGELEPDGSIIIRTADLAFARR